MFKFKLSDISDGLFILLSSFSIFFVILYYYLKNNVTAILLSVAFSAIVFCLYMIIKRKKKGKLSIKKEDEESFLKCVNAMCLLPNKECFDIIYETLLRLKKEPIKVENGIVVSDNFIYCKFSYDKISVSNVVSAYKKSPKGKNLVYLGVEFSPECEEFVNGFIKRIRLIKLSEIFPFMKKVNTVPSGGFLPLKKKIGFFTLIKQSFSKKKAKGYALYGIALLIMSNFVFFPLWYIISGSLLLIYAIIIKFFAPTPTENTFL